MKKVVPQYQPKAGSHPQVLKDQAASVVSWEALDGVVGRLLSGYSKARAAVSGSHLIPRIREGLPFQELEQLRTGLDQSMERLIPLLGISKATLHRRKAGGRLDAAESDRVVRYARVLGQAVGVMESLESGRRWLASPQVGLGGAVPLEYAQTEVGAREVENLLGRIDYGVYS
jgi:putative toxin-antitoxin system antitoxin component (TIGR02293 family)